MKISEIIELTKCGWTKEEILALAKMDQEQPQPEPVKEPEQPVQKAETKTEPVQEPKQEEKPAEPAQDNNAILNAIANLTKSIQSGAIMNSQMPKRENTEDILASIINPPSQS